MPTPKRSARSLISSARSRAAEPQTASLRSSRSSLPPKRAPPPLALPPKPRKARKPRELKAAGSDSSQPAKSGRASNAGATVIAALRKNPRPDRLKLAKAIYGDESKVAKVGQVLGYLTHAGKLTNNGDGSYTVNG